MTTSIRYVPTLGTLLMFFAGSVGTALAKPPPILPRPAPMPAYDPKTEVIFAGIVTETISSTREVRVVVNTAVGPIEVFLGPAKAVAALELALEPGDDVEITGSKVGPFGETFVIAREVIFGKTTFILRDASGAAVWKKVRSPAPGV